VTKPSAPRRALAAVLLPRFSEEDRDDMVQGLSVAYGSVGSDGKENWGLWGEQMRHVLTTLRDRYEAAGWTAPRLIRDSFWKRIESPRPSSDPVQHLRLIEAMVTDYCDAVQAHLAERLEEEGNVIAVFSGDTGMAKSSCAVSLAEELRTVTPDEFQRNLVIDVSRLSRALQGKTAGDWVLIDELLRTAGEGSRTLQALLENVEDTIRKSGVSVFLCAPAGTEHAAVKIEFEAILKNRKQMATLFLVWVNGQPHGVVAIHWMRSELYAVYEPWKDKNVARSLAGVFRDASAIPRLAIEAFSHELVVESLLDVHGRPKKGDYEEALRDFFPGMRTATESKAIASLMMKFASDWKRKEAKFERMYGLAPPPGLLAVAKLYAPKATRA
jgi:hypothetical protein